MDLPIPLLSDSYKASHFKSYPGSTLMVAVRVHATESSCRVSYAAKQKAYGKDEVWVQYGEFRTSYNKDPSDARIVFYGLRYILETYLHKQWTIRDVDNASRFFRTHKAPDNSSFEFPQQLFLDFIEEHNGYFPIKLQALREGTVIHARVPVYQITAAGKYAPLVTYMETVLTMVWYQTTVATLSRRARDVIEDAFEASAEGGRASPLVPSRLHDFGMRGCTCVEQTVLGGVAHLLNFDGSDTMSAGYYAQFHLNGGRPVASSIPATEHSVMTAWRTEREAILNMIEQYGQGLYACVMDSYDYEKALREVLPSVATEKVDAGGVLILRPDSGDIVQTVVAALEAAERIFGADVNSKGFRVPRGCGIIQGDGVDLGSLRAILTAVLERGFSAEAVAFGMGSGLLHKLNRDTLSFATKLSYIRYPDGSEANIMKNPTAGGKDSFPGVLAVKAVGSVPTVFPCSSGVVAPTENLLTTVYDHGPVEVTWESFDTLRERIKAEWQAQPPKADVVSEQLKDLTRDTLSQLRTKGERQ